MLTFTTHTLCSKHPARHFPLRYFVLSLNRPQQVGTIPIFVEETFETLVTYVTETSN